MLINERDTIAFLISIKKQKNTKNHCTKQLKTWFEVFQNAKYTESNGFPSFHQPQTKYDCNFARKT